MRIVEIIGTLQMGGAERQVVSLLNGWNSDHFEKHIICLSSVETILGAELGRDVVKHTVALPRWGQLKAIVELVRVLHRLSPDVVQAHMFHTNLYAVLAARIARVPVVITTEHGKNLWKRRIHHFMERRIISPLASARVAVSDDIRRIRIGTGDAPEHKISVIRPCVTIPEESALSGGSDVLRVGALGRLVDAKDYSTLIRAMGLVRSQGVPADLVLVGDGPERAQLEEVANDVGIREHVEFAGFQVKVDDWLSTFDVLAVSSVREGIPVAMLEAMAMGLPVVATAVGGIPEVIEDGVNGFLVQSGSPVQLAGGILNLLRCEDLRREIGSRGRKDVRRKFSREAICAEYEVLFRRLLNWSVDNV